MTDMQFAKYLLETLGPKLREAGQASSTSLFDDILSSSADDVEDAGHRLLHAAEIVHTLIGDDQ